jgi:hypothetical protein
VSAKGSTVLEEISSKRATIVRRLQARETNRRRALPVETPSLFAQAIQEHLELKQRNAALEPDLPIQSYKAADPFENHPLFKTEEQARLEETLDGSEPVVVAHTVPTDWPSSSADEPESSLEDSLWGQTTRDFDWGD